MSPDNVPGNLWRSLFVRKNVAGIFRGGWIDSDVALVDVLNDSVFIDHESCAIAEALLFIEDAVVFHHRAFEIAEQWKSDAVLGPEFFVSGNAVYTESENLRVGCFEFGDISLIRLHFLRSTTGESEHIKSQHHIFLAFEVAQFVTHAAAVSADHRAWQSEVRRGLPNFQGCVRRSWDGA